MSVTYINGGTFGGQNLDIVLCKATIPAFDLGALWLYMG